MKDTNWGGPVLIFLGAVAVIVAVFVAAASGGGR